MKSTKLIKAFMPFESSAALYDWCGRAAKNASKTAEAIELFTARDPGATEWTNLGLVEPLAQGNFVHDLDGKARMLKFQFSERKLPASVRDEKLNERYQELCQKEGRKLNKKEFAQLREDVEASLLPQAFIVRSVVPVFVFKDHMMICTASASKAEKILGHVVRLTQARKIEWTFSDMMGDITNTPGYVLGQVARLGFVRTADDNYTGLHARSAAVFKGEDKRAIRVKDRDLASEEIQAIANSGTYSVIELAIALHADNDLVADFTLTDKLIVKGIKLSDVTVAGIGGDVDDLHATYWLFAATLNTILQHVVYALNDGERDDAEDEEL